MLLPQLLPTTSTVMPCVLQHWIQLRLSFLKVPHQIWLPVTNRGWTKSKSQGNNNVWHSEKKGLKTLGSTKSLVREETKLEAKLLIKGAGSTNGQSSSSALYPPESPPGFFEQFNPLWLQIWSCWNSVSLKITRNHECRKDLQEGGKGKGWEGD